MKLSPPVSEPVGYMIIRSGESLAKAIRMERGFALVPCSYVDGGLRTDLGEIDPDDEHRFLYPEDARRALQRGIATVRDDGVLTGLRYPALAAFPQLRARHLLSWLAVSAPRSAPPSEHKPSGRRRRPRQVAERPQTLAEPAEPAPVATPASDEPAPAESIAVPGPEAPTESSEDLAATTPVDAEVAPVELSQGERPADQATDGDAIHGEIEASANRPLPEQLALARELVPRLYALDKTRPMAIRWLHELADRLRHRSDLLIGLIDGVWQYADAPGALAELRKAIALGSVSANQRSPIVVATLLRELARDVGDADALRTAYEGLAQLPDHRSSVSELVNLVRELDSEDVGTEGERLAVGVSLLLEAYKRADAETYATLAEPAERAARALLRQEPPNIDSALRLKPLLEQAHAHLDPPARAGVETVLRELLMASGVDPDQVGVAADRPRTIVSLRDALNYFATSTSNVDVLAAAYESVARWGKKPNKYVPQVHEAFEAMSAVADAYASGAIGPEGFYGAFRDRGQDLVRQDSDQTRQRFRDLYVTTDRQGRRVALTSHLRIGADFRIYFAVDERTRRLLVGHVGKHLRTRRG